MLAKIRKLIAKSDLEREAAGRAETLDDIERNAITEAMRRCNGNMSEAAKQLGITRQALYRRIEKFKL